MAAPSPSPLALLNGEPLASVPAVPQALLTQRPQGVYTSMLLTGEGQVADYGLHKERLERNISLMHESRGTFAKTTAWLQDQGRDAAWLIRHHVTPQVQEALRQYMAGPAGIARSVVMVLLDEPAQQGAGSGSGSVPGSGSSQPPLDVLVFCTPSPQPRLDVPLEVCVSGPPRSIARAKHAQWVVERKVLQDTKPANMAEVLLSDPEGNLLEGLTTNFAVVAEVPGQGAVLMVPGEGEMALQGVVKQRLVQACSLIGLPVVSRAPNVSERDTWREALISNCLRLLQPVGKVHCLEGQNHWGHPGWEVELPGAPGPYTRALQEALGRVMDLRGVEQL